MIGRVLLGPFFLVEPWLRHPSWMVRRPAQIVVFAIAILWLVLPRSERTADRWFNTAARFERDPRNQLASNIRMFPLRLTGLRADGFNNWDLSLFKNFRIAES